MPLKGNDMVWWCMINGPCLKLICWWSKITIITLHPYFQSFGPVIFECIWWVFFCLVATTFYILLESLDDNIILWCSSGEIAWRILPKLICSLYPHLVSCHVGPLVHLGLHKVWGLSFDPFPCPRRAKKGKKNKKRKN